MYKKYTRNVLPDQLQEIRKIDSLNLNDIINKLSTNHDLVVYKDSCSVVIQSRQFTNGIPKYILRVSRISPWFILQYSYSCLQQNNKVRNVVNDFVVFKFNFNISHKKKIVLET